MSETTPAAASSEPDLLYSFGSGFRESLSWVSLRAEKTLDCEIGRIEVRAVNADLARRERRREVVNMVAVASVDVGLECGM